MAERNDTLGISVSVAKSAKHAEHPKAGVSPSLSRLRLIQVCGKEGDGVAIDAFACASELREIMAPLCGKTLVTFDGVTLMRHLIHAGLPEKTPECCMLQWNALTNETAKTLTFESVLRRTLGVEVADESSLPDWGRKSLTPAQMEHAAGRAMHLVRLHEALAARLRMKTLDQVYLRMRDAQRVIARMELHGIGFDAAGHAALVAQWQAEADALEKKLRKSAGPDINFDSDKQVGDWLRRTLPRERVAAWPRTPKEGLLRTAAAVLEEHSDIEAVSLLLQFSRLSDSLSRYGGSLAAFFDPVTGRMHADFHLTGAVTGRLSSSQPNLHSIPRRGGMKAFVVNTVHDDIMVECPKSEAEKVEDILRESMTQAMLEMFPKAPTLRLVECGTGKSWAETK